MEERRLNGLSREEYTRVCTKMQTWELERRIENEAYLIRSVEEILKWLKIGRSEEGPKNIEHYEERLKELRTCRTIKELILIKRGI